MYQAIPPKRVLDIPLIQAVFKDANCKLGAAWGRPLTRSR